MSAWARFTQVWGILWGVFLAGAAVAQGWQAVDASGTVVFTLPKTDSLKLIGDGTLLSREGTGWYLRRCRDGEVVAGPVLPEPKHSSFGTLYPTQNGAMVAVPTGPGTLVAGTRLLDLGQGWLLDKAPGGTPTVYSREGWTVVCPPGTDTVLTLGRQHLIYGLSGRRGLIHQSGEEAHAVLPAVYDSIAGPNQGFLLAYAQGKVQLYDEGGHPVYKGAFQQARFLNRHWMAGLTPAGWKAVQLPSLKLYPSPAMPQALGMGHCALPRGVYCQVLDSAGNLVAEKLEAAIAQTGTDRLVVRRGGQWYLLSEAGTASVYLKTPHLLQMKPFSEGLAPLCTQAGLWGFADASGFVRIAPRYRACTPFAQGLAGVRIGPYWGLIDKAERLVCQPRCDSVRFLPETGAWVCQGSSRTELLYQGRVVGTYRDVRPAGANLLIRENTGWGLVNKQGGALIPPWYSSLEPTKDGLLLARRGDEWAVLSATHQILLPWQPRRIRWDSVAGIFFVERVSASAND